MKSLDLSKFKKISSTNTHTTFSHPDGHFMKVSHKNLPQEAMGDLKKLAKHYDEGGKVDGPISKDTADIFAKGMGITPDPTPSPTPDPKVMYAGGYADGGEVDGVVRAQELMSPQNQEEPMITPEQQAEVSQVPQNPPIAQQQQQPIGDVFGNQAYGNAMQQSEQAGLESATQQRQASTELGQRQVATAQNAADSMQALQQSYQNNFDKLNQKSEEIQHAIMEGKIDPNQYIKNMSTGDKILTGIGMLVGGLSATGNAGVQFLQRNIDRDIEAQKLNLGTKESLLAANLRQYGNLKDATDMSRATTMDMMAAKMKQDAASVASPQAQANYLAEISKIEQTSAQYKQQVAARQAMLQGAQSGSPQGMSLIRSQIDPKEAGLADKTERAHQAADMLYNQLEQEQTAGNRLMNPLQSTKKIQAIRAQLVPLIQEMDPSKRLTPEVLKAEIDPLVAGFLNNKGTKEQLRQDLHNLINTHAPSTPQLDSYGLGPKYTPAPKQGMAMKGYKQ